MVVRHTDILSRLGEDQVIMARQLLIRMLPINPVRVENSIEKPGSKIYYFDFDELYSAIRNKRCNSRGRKGKAAELKERITCLLDDMRKKSAQ